MARRGFSTMKPKTGNNDSLRMEELVELYRFQDNPDEWIQLRFLDTDILPVRRHWIKIRAGKTKKEVTIPRFCVSFNPDNEDEPLDAECPYCDISTEGGQDAPMRNEHFYLVNAIVRDIQEDEPARKSPPTSKEKKTGYKEIKSKSWTPVRVIRLTNTLVARIQELGETNIVKNKKTGQKKSFDVTHPKFGVDVSVKYKPKASGTDKYSADKIEGRTPLTEEEQSYLTWNLSPELLDAAGRLSEAQAKEDFKRMEVIDSEAIDDDDEDEDDDELDLDAGRGRGRSKSKSKGRSRSKSKSDDEDEDDDALDSDDDEDEDEDEPPKRRSKSKSKSKSSSKSRSRRKSALDDDDDDEDEDEDEPPKRSRSSSKSVLDDDDDDWDDDGDDEPQKRSRSKSKSTSKTKSSSKSRRKPSLDEDEDDDEDDDVPF